MKSSNAKVGRLIAAFFAAILLITLVPGLGDGLLLARPLFAAVPNGGFETGDFTGWTVDTSFPGLPGDDGLDIHQSASVQSSMTYEGSYAAMLEVKGTSLPQGTIHGPELTSSTFAASAGENVAVSMYTINIGNDYYDVYGYVDNVATGQTQQLFYERGASTGDWVLLHGTIPSSICPSGTCTQLQFRFLCGVYNGATGNNGRSVRSTLYLDSIRTNTPPVIAEGSAISVTMSEDGSPTPFSLTLNASDVDGDTITWSILTQASHGAASASGAGASKAISYSPTANYNGDDSFVVRVSDGNGGTDETTVNVTIQSVNDAPLIAEGSAISVTMSEDGSPTPFSLTLNTSDVDGDTITWSVLTQASHGSASAFGAGASKAISYNSTADFNGNDSFVVRVSDGNGGTDDITVNVTVQPVDDAPVAVHDTYTTPEDTRLVVASSGILTNDSDVEGDTLTTVLESGPANGGLELYSDGSFVYTPTLNYNGVITFTYRAVGGGEESNTGTVTITVSPENDGPAAVDDGFTVDENSSSNVLDVLDNDVDPESALTIIDLGTPGSGGTLSHDGTAVTYTPAPEFFGTEVFTYVISNGSLSDTATVTVTVTRVDYFIYLPLVVCNH